MSDTSSPDVSHGTCYYAQNSEAKGDFIPCGNIEWGDWPCCHVGSICLGYDDSNACWDYDTGNTYVAGCTDSGYSARVCPNKTPLFDDQEWVAIQQCESSDDGMQWGGCEVDTDLTSLTRLPHSSCDPYCSSIPVYVGSKTLSAYATVPSRAGGTIIWTNGFDPNTLKAPKSTTTSQSATESSQQVSTSASASSQTTSTSIPTTSAHSDDNSLSTGAKAGIGIGSVGAALFFVVAILLGLLVRRRRRKNRENNNSHYTMPPDQQSGYYDPNTTAGPHSSPPQGPYEGFKSELPADAPVRHASSPLFKVDGNSILSQSPHLSTGTGTSNSPYQAYSPYNEGSTISDASTLPGGGGGYARHVSPQTTGELQGSPPPGQGGHGAMAPIQELQG
ncbi:uncharacterized protein BCR38DRAFT_372584 [Pseudomassariella vexata]|uniref:Uncharacterized protein n=1 Tax=Pseudomassariella vexata TaxID=1141098 RepID=A0A1Y2DTW6_9PEZI|nr:uncharacterized protein BCR38DRAFT_372584 [Pseudomassariella vexata]ORY62594.1 hypothetical protein BCR38DRAFT_372584 [Pseudomassariella vexata]